MALTISKNIPTQSELVTNYFNYLRSYNPDINPDIDAILQVLGNVYAGMLAGNYSTIYLYGLNIFPQTASGQFLDIQLAEWGLPPRSGGKYALGTARLPSAATSIINISEGSILNSNTGLQYVVMQDTIIGISSVGSIPIRSSIASSGYQLPVDSQLFLQISIGDVNQLLVVSLNDGAGIETDTEVQARLLDAIQNYQLGGTKGDYKQWCLQGDAAVTDAYITLGETLNQIYVYLIGGQLNINNVLKNPALIYDRSVNSTAITNVSNYIEGKRPFTDDPIVSSCDTFLITESIVINVKLAAGYTLSTNVIDPNLPVSPITVSNLIKQEFRRAIILSSQYAQKDNISGDYFILSVTLEKQLLLSLAASSLYPGIYVQIISELIITLVNPIGIIVPNPAIATGGNNNKVIYDIGYSSMTVGLII